MIHREFQVLAKYFMYGSGSGYLCTWTIMNYLSAVCTYRYPEYKVLLNYNYTYILYILNKFYDTRITSASQTMPGSVGGKEDPPLVMAS